MQPRIYLIAPTDAPVDQIVARAMNMIARSDVAALLLPRGDRPEAGYRELLAATVPSVQAAGAAVLIEGEPDLVRTLNADGLHVSGTVSAVKAAVEALKPDYIVGAGGIRSRHDAMQKGEAGVDYILFGPLSGPISSAERDLARWWAETMEVPSVLSDPEAGLLGFDAEGCEFIGLGLSAGALVP